MLLLAEPSLHSHMHDHNRRKLRIVEWKKQESSRVLAENVKQYDPNKDPHIDGDPYKTLFIGSLSRDVTEKKLKREFQEFGAVKRVRIVHDTKGAAPLQWVSGLIAGYNRCLLLP